MHVEHKRDENRVSDKERERNTDRGRNREKREREWESACIGIVFTGYTQLAHHVVILSRSLCGSLPSLSVWIAALFLALWQALKWSNFVAVH